VDEAKSVPDEIFMGVDRILSTGKAQVLIASTPGVQLSGGFFECFTKRRDRFYCMHVPAKRLSTTPFFASRVNQEWADRIIREYGVDHPFTQSAVFAEFVEATEDVLIPLQWAECCVRADMPGMLTEPSMGVDVGRSVEGDESVIAIAEGARVLPLLCLREKDTMKLVGKVVQLMRQHNIRPENISVDETGVGGGVVDRLKEIGIRVNAVNFGAPATDRTKYKDRSAEMWGEVRKRAQKQFAYSRDGKAGEDGLSLPDDPKLLQQFASRRFKVLSNGTIQLESKLEMRQRGMASPDRADAVVLALYGRTSARFNVVVSEEEEARRTVMVQKENAKEAIRQLMAQAQAEADKRRADN
jgi:hypothetical protein